MTDLDIAPLGDDEEKDEWSPRKSQKRGRPRPKRQANCENGGDAETTQQPGFCQGDAAAEQPAFDIRLDSENEVQDGDGETQGVESPGLRQIDLNRVSIRSKSGPPRHRRVPNMDEQRPSATSPARPSLASLDTVTDCSSSKVNGGLPTPTSTSSDHGFEQQGNQADPPESCEGFDTILESEGFTMIDLESIPSARNFSNPPSEDGHEKVERHRTMQTTTEPDLTSKSNSQQSPISSPLPPKQKEQRTSTITSYLTLAEGESDLSSTVPSSPPIPVPTPAESRAKIQPQQCKVTPQPLRSSPKLPSPPKAFAPVVPSGLRHSRVSTPPKLAKVVKAGTALQGVLSPKPVSDSQSKLAEGFQSPKSTAKERIDGLFEGFDSGTRRELRAGLRLGEELAKRQTARSPVVDQQPVAQLTKPTTKLNATTQVWRGENTVQHTPVGLPSKTEDMVEKGTHAEACVPSTEAKRSRYSSAEPSAQLSTPLQQNTPSLYQHNNVEISRSLQKEQEWQLEREAVSRDIQNASADRLIVIDSDSDHEDQSEKLDPREVALEAEEEVGNKTEGDLWLAEAEAHSSTQSHDAAARAELFPSAEQRKQMERACKVVSKPRRSLIPSPWKRGEEVDSTFMTHGEMSGMAWQQPRFYKGFAAGVIEREKQGRSSSDTFSPAPIGIQEPEPQSNDLSQDDLDETYGSSEIDLEAQELPLRNEKQQEELDAVEEDSACQLQEGQVEDTEDLVEEDDETSIEASSLPPQPVKIPVNFNDSTLSAAAPQYSPPDSSRPSTPRSALKGSRISLGLDDSVKKVVFSPQCHGMDETGNESSLKLKSLSPTPPCSVASEHECVRTEAGPLAAINVCSQRKEKPTPRNTPEIQLKSSWLGWLWGSKSNPSAKPHPGPIPTVDGGAVDWQPITTSSIRSSKPAARVPSYLLPPSYPSDPSRDVSIPMSVSGAFTDTHFRTLHIIYGKSGRPRFHAPKSIRPGLQRLLGQKFQAEEGEYGFFGWTVDGDAAKVVERFMQEVEEGWVGKEVEEGRRVKWGWSEREIMQRLFRIVVGEEVRMEQVVRRGELVGERERKGAEGRA